MEDSFLNRNRNISRGFRKLEVWKEAIDFYAFVCEKLDTLHQIPFKTKGQVDASAFSIHSNIAEGYARRSLRDHINFNNYALGSLGENYSQIIALLEANRLDREWVDEYDKMHYSLENKLIAYNRTLVKKLKEKGNWNDDYILREGEEPYE